MQTGDNMEYIVAADTDIGISKKVNQDSVCVKTAQIGDNKAALVLVCDGMGGLSKGELASATVIRSFSDWFEYDFAYELEKWDWQDASQSFILRIRALNAKLIQYGNAHGIQLGTTLSGMLVINSQMMTFHVGDSRIYKLAYDIQQLTEDHTFVNREIKRGAMTREEALKDPRRNALTQCIGAAGNVTPDIRYANVDFDTNYLICSDGFRHMITEKEIYKALSPKKVTTKSSMQAKIRELIELVKSRKENDNITAAVFRAES